MTIDLAYKGIIQVTGGVGVGKTSFATEIGHVKPSEIVYVNYDVKHPGIQFGQYHQMLDGDVIGGTELKLAEETIALLESLKPVEQRVLIIDAWETAYKCLSSFVFKNAAKLRTTWSPNGKFATMQKLAYAKTIEAKLFATLQEKFDVVFVINHLADQYEGDIRTGKQIPDSSDRLDKLSKLRFWLRFNPKHPAPVALVLKNASKRVYVDSVGIRSVNVLPPRVDPQALPGYESMDYVSLWDVVDHYLRNPVGARELLDYERPTEFEESLIYGTYTQDQLDAIAYTRKMRESDGVENRVAEIVAGGVSDPMIVYESVRAEFPSVTLPQIIQLVTTS